MDSRAQGHADAAPHTGQPTAAARTEGERLTMVYLGPLTGQTDADVVADSLTDSLANWDLVACTPDCGRPWRRRRWLAPRVWTCPGCRTRWTVEDHAWVKVMSPTQLARLERELGIGDTAHADGADLRGSPRIL